MSLRILLVRHAETAWNREHRYQGWQDLPLSPAGRRQAEALARALGDSALAAVYASPLRRARETAAPIAAAHGLEVHVIEALKEMGFGRWEGLTAEEARRLAPADYQAWVDTPHLAGPPGGETLAGVRARVLAALDDLRAAHPDEAVCVVSHGVTARLLILEALGLPLERLWAVHVSPTGLSELEFRDDWTALHRMNTLAHLEAVALDR